MKDPYYSRRLQKSKAMRKTQGLIRPLSEEIQSVMRLLLATIGGLLVILTIGFLYNSSLQAAKGYHLKQLQLDYDQLLTKNRELQGDINQAQSIMNLNEDDQILEMQDPTENDMSYMGTETDLASR